MSSIPTINKKLLNHFIKMFGCDTVRIIRPCGTYYLIIGWNTRSEGEWFDQDGQPRNFDYVNESVIASGDSLKKLNQSAKYYQNY